MKYHYQTVHNYTYNLNEEQHKFRANKKEKEEMGFDKDTKGSKNSSPYTPQTIWVYLSLSHLKLFLKEPFTFPSTVYTLQLATLFFLCNSGSFKLQFLVNDLPPFLNLTSLFELEFETWIWVSVVVVVVCAYEALQHLRSWRVVGGLGFWAFELSAAACILPSPHDLDLNSSIYKIHSECENSISPQHLSRFYK